MLGSRAGEMLEGKGEFTSFQWDGWSVATDDFSFTAANGVQKFIAQQIEADVDIGAIWSSAYRLENIQLREFAFQGDFRSGVTGTGEVDSWKSESGSARPCRDQRSGCGFGEWRSLDGFG